MGDSRIVIPVIVGILILGTLGLSQNAYAPSFEVVKLTALDQAAGDRFGRSVSIDGDTAIVGAFRDDSRSGSAYIFVKNGATWTQAAKLTASDAASGDEFGRSVSIDGDTVIVGAHFHDGPDNSGSAYVFVKPGGGWVDSTQTAKLTASDAADGDGFGRSVSISGDTVIVGARFDDDVADNSGSAYVFVKPGGGWVDSTQTAKLTASDAGGDARFGESVSIDGDTAIVGAFRDDSVSGSAYVFVKPGGGWVDSTQTAKLRASDAASGDRFGASVSIDGDTAIVGAYFDDEPNTSGSAYVFVKPGGGWVDSTQTAKLRASDAGSFDEFGRSVSIDGDTVIVGARLENVPNFDAGSAYIFVKPAGAWVDSTQTVKLTASDAGRDDRFGLSVSISGDTLIVGTHGDQDIEFGPNSAAYVFTLIPVNVDIKPGSDPNCINEKKKGKTPIAILGTDTFDITTIDQSTIELDDDDDSATAGISPTKITVKDVNDDGFDDLVLKFSSVEMKDEGFLTDNNELFVTGELNDDTPIIGLDIINLAGGPNCFD